jgi:pyruvoyl-dependent arginine decarboxylase (PvlArgDC)
LLSKEALQELADDIKKNGLLEPPILWHDVDEDKVYLLDGRNRLDAMELAGIDFLRDRFTTGHLDWHLPSTESKPGLADRDFISTMQPTLLQSAADSPTVTLGKEGTLANTRTYHDAAAFVIAANLLRRHLPPGEIVRLALAIRATTPTRDPVETATSVGVSLGGRGKTGEASEIAKETGVNVRTVQRAIEKARQSAAPKYNSEAYKLQREKQAKAVATRQAKRDADQAEYEKAEAKRKTKEEAHRENVQQRLLDFCQKQVDSGNPARLNILRWLVQEALDDRRFNGQGEKRAVDLMQSAGDLP